MFLSNGGGGGEDDGKAQVHRNVAGSNPTRQPFG